MADKNVLDAAISELVAANRILHSLGIVDAFGHVSRRHPHDPHRFLLSRNRAPAMVGPVDIVIHGLDGEPVAATPTALYLERYIHAAIYRARPDIDAVVHSHSRAVIPFSLVPGMTLRPVCHMAGFLGTGAPIFDIRDCAGESTDLLIRSNSIGDELARSLGSASVILMRGHGTTAVGDSLAEAVFHAVYAEWNASIQAQAMAVGEPIILTAAEAEAAAASNKGQIDRAWAYWHSRITPDNDGPVWSDVHF